jgi:hypothetical protein
MKKSERERVQEILFMQSRGTKCDIQYLARRTGIPEETLRRYRREPDTIPFCRLVAIADGMGISVADVGYLVTGRRK